MEEKINKREDSSEHSISRKEQKDAVVDERLVKRLKEGDQLAFSIIYKEYAEQAFSLSYKYLSDKYLAEDAVQNLFVKLWVRRDNLDETKPLNRYIFTILKNDLLNILRDTKNHVFLLEDCMNLLANIEEKDLSDPVDQEQMSIIKKSIELLPPQRRKIFDMKLEEKYSNKEIADILNISENTVKFQYSQALRQIRAALKGLFILLLGNHIV